MADDRFRGKLGAVITLGTPHQGSALAALGIGRLARQLRPANSIFEQLAAQKSDENVAKLSLFTSLDNMVFPTRLLEIAEPGWEQECIAPDVGHVGLLYDRGVVQKTIALLEKCQQSGGFECS
jgi:triacylglycerol esterase/lipase EstA (alpha/beta hydrolase family)